MQVRMVSIARHQWYGKWLEPGEEFDCNEDLVLWMQRMGRAKPAQPKSQVYRTRVMTAEKPGTLHLPKRNKAVAR